MQKCQPVGRISRRRNPPIVATAEGGGIRVAALRYSALRAAPCGVTRSSETAVEFAGVSRYITAMSPAVKTILERVASWPAEDQEELSEFAREIEARRTGVYRLSDEERAAIAAARRGPLAADDEVEAFWKRRGLP